MRSETGRLARFVGSPAFRMTALALILINAAVVGLETSTGIVERWGRALAQLQAALQTLFVLEIALRVAAHGRRPLAFFRDGWNVFDFLVVGGSLLPGAGPFATVARLARVLRIARLASALPELRLIIGTMLRSIPSMGHVITLLALLLYIYGVLGVHLFRADAPQQWGSLALALQSLFQVLTLEGWVEMQAAVLPNHPWAWAYFASFIFVAVFVVINLFIAVVINNLEKTRHEEDARLQDQAEGDGVVEHVTQLRARLDALESLLRSTRQGDRDRERKGPRRAEARAAS